MPITTRDNVILEDEFGTLKSDLSTLNAASISVKNSAVNYRLSATVEHSGGHAGGGHFVGFLLIDGEWFVTNDDKALRHSSYYPEYDHERSIIFMYYRVDDLPSRPMFD